MIWRYSILPQLIDTVTQVGATELLDPKERLSWLTDAGYADAADRWASFDTFLSTIGLAVREEGCGLTRALAVVEIPPGSVNEYLPDGNTPATEDEAPALQDIREDGGVGADD
jgi:hypothetical protein